VLYLDQKTHIGIAMLALSLNLIHQFVLPLAIGYVIGNTVVTIKQIIRTKKLTNNAFEDIQKFREILNSSPFLLNQTILEYQHLFDQKELQSLKHLQLAQVKYELKLLEVSELELDILLTGSDQIPSSQRDPMIETILGQKKAISQKRGYLLNEVLGIKI
jgi:hypothetical protein